VIGLAGQGTHERLAGHSAIPVACGHGVAGRIRQAPGRAGAFIDTVGADYMQVAPELGIEPSRVGTIVTIGAGRQALGQLDLGGHERFGISMRRSADDLHRCAPS
jgi:hypothetical protein